MPNWAPISYDLVCSRMSDAGSLDADDGRIALATAAVRSCTSSFLQMFFTCMPVAACLREAGRGERREGLRPPERVFEKVNGQDCGRQPDYFDVAAVRLTWIPSFRMRN